MLAKIVAIFRALPRFNSQEGWRCCECGALDLDHAPTCPYR